MNPQDFKTKSGKTIQDFDVPEKMLTDDPALVQLVMESESMNDSERQYWFNLMAIMTPDQVEKLRGILTREKQKLAEIEAKYSKKREEIDPEEAARRSHAQAEARRKQQADLKAREAAHEEAEDEDAVLAELEGL